VTLETPVINPGEEFLSDFLFDFLLLLFEPEFESDSPSFSSSLLSSFPFPLPDALLSSSESFPLLDPLALLSSALLSLPFPLPAFESFPVSLPALAEPSSLLVDLAVFPSSNLPFGFAPSAGGGEVATPSIVFFESPELAICSFDLVPASPPSSDDSLLLAAGWDVAGAGEVAAG